MAKADFYELLGVAKDVDGRTIKKAYRKLALKYHPDRNPDDAEAEESFKAVSEAYEVLSNTEKRGIYDRFGHAGLEGRGMGGGFGDVSDIFSHFGDVFGDLFGFGRGRQRVRRGADLRYNLQVSLEDCLTGVERDLEIPRDVDCETCSGTGAKPGTKPVKCTTCDGQGQVLMNRGFIQMATTCRACAGHGKVIRHGCKTCKGKGKKTETSRVNVKIPAGIDEGMKLRLTGLGQPAPEGGEPGHLYVVIHLEEHPRFQRHNADLVGELKVGMVRAALGGKIEVETLSGKRTVDVKPGTQPGAVTRLRNEGLPYLDGRPGRGDLLLQYVIEIPTELTDKQRELLESFDA